MSCSAGKRSILKSLTKRNFASQPSLKTTANAYELEASTSAKGSRLIALNKESPLLKVTISYKAGTRYETPDNYGISHIIRAATGLSTKNFTPFNIHRNLQQYGINIYANSDRESFSYTVESNRDQLDCALNYLTDIATHPLFKPWEIQDNRGRVKTELSYVSPEAKAIDLLHAAAYEGGLGNSLFCEESRIGKLGFEDCLQFFDNNFTFPRLQITAFGLDLPFLEEYVTAIDLLETPAAAVKPTYVGGEIKVANYVENVAHIVIAGETPGATKKENLAYAVLKYIYGAPTPIKYGEDHGILSKALKQANVSAAALGFNATYSDSGLTGFYIISDPADAPNALKAVFTAFSKAEITDDDVKRGKALLKANLLTNSEFSYVTEYIAKQVALDAVTTPEQIAIAVDSVSAADVKQAAKKLASGKLSSAYYGNIAAVPSLVAL